MKEVSEIKIIRKNDAIYLRGKGLEKYVIHGDYHRFYVVENQDVLKLLEEYRESIKIY